MSEHPPDNRRFGKRVALIAVLTVAGITILMMVGPGAFSARVFNGEYVCGYCGLRRDLYTRSILGVAYETRSTLGDTAISRALKPGRNQKCHHEWYLIRWGAMSLGEAADGGTQFRTVKMLIRDDDFARELAAMANARQIWHAIMEAGDKSPEEMESLMGEWYWTGPDREPFAEWWAANAARVKRLGLASRHNDS